jgi:mannose-1-phosphate guanylyltransferase
MKALILAAGEGTRLRPLTLTCPKPMLPVGGTPLLAHIFRWVRGQGVDEVAVNLHYLPEVVTGFVGDGSRFGLRVTYSREDPILGSAGAAKKLQGYLDTSFLVVYGDMLLDVELDPLLDLHRESGALLTAGLMWTDDPSSKGIAELDGQCRVVRFVEKPRPGEIEGNLASAGIYVAEPELLDFIPSEVCYDIGGDLLPDLLRRGLPVYGNLLEGYLLDIGTHEAYRQSQADLGGLGKHWI